jgi:hypothetical protein
MPYWTERLTVEFLRSQETAGASVTTSAVGYDLRWPNGDAISGAVFNREEAERPGTILVSLEDERVRGLTTNLPVFAPGQPLPSLVIPDVSEKISGVWSLWRIRLQTPEGREQRFHALFISDDGQVFGPTARAIWDRLIDLPHDLSQANTDLSGSSAVETYTTNRRAAEAQGAMIFAELSTAHHQRIIRERTKGDQAFASRRRAIERLGLPHVRAHRLRLLAEEERTWSEELAAREAALPDLTAVLLVRVTRAGVRQ